MLRRELRKLTKALDGAAKTMEEQKKILQQREKVEKRLIEIGEKEFVLLNQRRQQAMHDFFGGQQMNSFGKAVFTLTQTGNILQNFTYAIREDVREKLFGIEKAQKDQGARIESFTNRLLGAPKYFFDEDEDEVQREQPVRDQKVEERLKGVAGMLSPLEHLEEIAKSLHEMLEIWTESSRDAKIRTREERNQALSDLIERRHEAVFRKNREAEQQASQGQGQDQDEGGLGDAAEAALGAFFGGAASGAFGRFARAGKVVTKIGGIGMALISIASDGVLGYLNSEDWKTSGLSATIGGLLGGSGAGANNAAWKALSGAGTGAMIGATFGGPLGAIAGGLIGAVTGALLGYIGGEKIAKAIDGYVQPLIKEFDAALGTSFALSEESVRDQLAKTIKANEELTDNLRRAIAGLADASQESIRGMIDDLKAVDAEFERQKRELRESQTSAIRKIDEFVGGWVNFLGFDLIPDALFGTEFHEETRRRALETAQAARDTAIRAISHYNDQIEKTTALIAQARERGDAETVSALEKRLARLKSLRQVEQAALDATQSKIADLEAGMKTMWGKMVDALSGAWEWQVRKSGEVGAWVSETMKSLWSSVKDFFKKIISWDYWFGDQSVPDSLKLDVRRAQEEERQRGRLITKIDSELSGFFSSGSKNLADALEQFRQGKIDLAEFRRKIEEAQATNDTKVSAEAGRVLEHIAAFERYRRAMAAEISGRERNTGTKLAETNAFNEETAMIRQRKLAAPTGMNVNQYSSMVVSNNSSVVIPLTPWNRDPSFNAGVAGTRNSANAATR